MGRQCIALAGIQGKNVVKLYYTFYKLHTMKFCRISHTLRFFCIFL